MPIGYLGLGMVGLVAIGALSLLFIDKVRNIKRKGDD